jgi:hypothetical protein
VRIDALFERGDIEAPDFVKIDVEGHAGSALQGMRSLLDAARPVVLLSTHGNDEARAIAEFFAQLRYRAKWSVSGGSWDPDHQRADEGVTMLP